MYDCSGGSKCNEMRYTNNSGCDIRQYWSIRIPSYQTRIELNNFTTTTTINTTATVTFTATTVITTIINLHQIMMRFLSL